MIETHGVPDVHTDEPIQPVAHMPWFHDVELHRLIELDAYLLAEQDNFKQSPQYYWLAAERNLISTLH